jgi:retron-type reverse transcriptase
MMNEEKTKSFAVSKQMVYSSYLKVCDKKGSAGIDKETIEIFNENLSGNLYKVWNRMSSGSYFPPAVRTVLIPKKQGGKRPLGIPTLLSYYLFTVCVRDVFVISKFQQKNRQFKIDLNTMRSIPMS